jgi:hypothetical protein
MSDGVTVAGPGPSDAISQLTAEHRQVERWFSEFQATTSMVREEDLAFNICNAIRIHLRIDQEVFYPAYLRSTGDEYRHDAAMNEHQYMLELIDEIERSGPTEDVFFAKIHVLCSLFAAHVHGEEKAQGVFNEAQHAPIDLHVLGDELTKSRSRLVELLQASGGSSFY